MQPCQNPPLSGLPQPQTPPSASFFKELRPLGGTVRILGTLSPDPREDPELARPRGAHRGSFLPSYAPTLSQAFRLLPGVLLLFLTGGGLERLSLDRSGAPDRPVLLSCLSFPIHSIGG